MLTRNRTLIALILGIVVVTVTACALVRQLNGFASTGSPTTLPSAAPTSPAATTSTPATSPSPSSKPTLSKTQADITAAVTNYYKVTDELEQKPPRDPYKKLWTVAKDEAFDMWQDAVLQDVRSGQHQTGSTKVLSIKVGKAVKPSLYQVSTCVDVSSVDIVDKSGKSVITGDRPDRAASALKVRNDKGSWYVVQDRDGTQKC